MKRTTLSERALILAPRGRDAAIAVAMLGEAGMSANVCASLPDLIGQLDAGAGFVVVTEEALVTADLAPLAAWLADQQEWSDLPIVLLTSQGGGLERNPAAQRYLNLLGNVTFLERPFHPTTLVSLARSVLRARRRQYEARARLEALRDSQERFRTLFETMDEGFCVIEFLDGPQGPLSDYVHVEANPAYEQHAGIADIVGKRLREIVSDSEADAWAEIYRRVLLTGEPIRFARELVETGRHLELAAFRVEPASRRQVAVLFQDATDRVRAEAALRDFNNTLERRVAERTAERETLARLVESTGASVQALDLDYCWTAINEAAVEAYERLYGAHPEVGGSLRELLADRPEEWAAAKAAWDRALAGEAYSETAEWGDPGRERCVYDMRFEVLRDPSGQVTGAFLTGLDVTDRIHAQAALAEAEAARREADALYRAFFESSPEALFVIGVTSEGVFVVEEVNPAHEAGVGFRIADIRGKRIEEILPPNLAEQVLVHYRRAVETGEIEQWREVYELQDGAQYWDTSLVPIRGPDGRIVRLLGASRNVTRQVTTEEALRQSQKLEAMGSLTGGVAHDFNNLLTPIIGSLDRLLTRRVGTEREQQLMAGALESAERAKVLVQRLLAFARRQPLQATAVDLQQLVHGMAGLIGSTLSPKIDVHIEMDANLPPVRADAHQLEMALLNLAVNARDAMPMGGVLTVAASRRSVSGRHRSELKPGHYVRLSVIDTGTGMDRATLARAVEPFFSTKGIGRGTGLGLSMVHGLAAQLDGGLTIQSEPGQGTTVELWLPISIEPAEETSTDRQLSPIPQLRGRALLVDDEELVRMSTADMLGDLGFDVVEVGSAEEALRLVREGITVELLVTDHLMPGMSGAELAREVRSLRSGLPVLIVSGYAEVDGIASDLPRLVKPFRARDLAEQVVSMMPDGGTPG